MSVCPSFCRFVCQSAGLHVIATWQLILLYFFKSIFILYGYFLVIAAIKIENTSYIFIFRKETMPPEIQNAANQYTLESANVTLDR